MRQDDLWSRCRLHHDHRRLPTRVLPAPHLDAKEGLCVPAVHTNNKMYAPLQVPITVL